MPHADSALIPPGLSKVEFWDHVYEQLSALLEGQRSWVSIYVLASHRFIQIAKQVVNLANASSLVYSSLLAFNPFFGDGDRAVNWCGEYAQASRMIN